MHARWCARIYERRSNMSSALDVVRRFYEVTGAGRASDLGGLVTGDVEFRGPLMQATGALEYVAMNARLLGFHRATRMLHQFEGDDDVCSIYEMDMSTPAGDGITLTMADWITVREGRIARQQVLFDPREFAIAFDLGHTGEDSTRAVRTMCSRSEFASSLTDFAGRSLRRLVSLAEEGARRWLLGGTSRPNFSSADSHASGPGGMPPGCEKRSGDREQEDQE